MLGRLFGTNKAIDDLTDPDKGHIAKVGKFLGGLHFSEQERAEWAIRQLEAVEPFKVVQRILAFACMFVWVTGALVFFVSLLAFTDTIILEDGTRETFNPITPRLVEFLFSDYVFWPVLSVFSLYVGGGFLNSARGKSK